MDTESNTVQTPSCHGTKMFMVGFVTHTRRRNEYRTRPRPRESGGNREFHR